MCKLLLPSVAVWSIGGTSRKKLARTGSDPAPHQSFHHYGSKEPHKWSQWELGISFQWELLHSLQSASPHQDAILHPISGSVFVCPKFCSSMQNQIPSHKMVMKSAGSISERERSRATLFWAHLVWAVSKPQDIPSKWLIAEISNLSKKIVPCCWIIFQQERKREGLGRDWYPLIWEYLRYP